MHEDVAASTVAGPGALKPCFLGACWGMLDVVRSGVLPGPGSDMRALGLSESGTAKCSGYGFWWILPIACSIFSIFYVFSSTFWNAPFSSLFWIVFNGISHCISDPSLTASLTLLPATRCCGLPQGECHCHRRPWSKSRGRTKNLQLMNGSAQANNSTLKEYGPAVGGDIFQTSKAKA